MNTSVQSTVHCAAVVTLTSVGWLGGVWGVFCESCDGKFHTLLPFSHMGFVFHAVYCLAIRLTTSPLSNVVKMLTHVLWSAVPPSSVASESVSLFVCVF